MKSLFTISQSIQALVRSAAILTISMFVLPSVIFSQSPQKSTSSPSNEEDPFYFIRPLPDAVGFGFVGAGVTGGAGGQEVTVTNAEDLLRFATSNDPYIINVVDTIEIVRGIGAYRESGGEYFLGSNTTLRGVGPNATIMYGGFKIQEIENVIIQNLHFDGTYSGFVPSLENVPCNQLPPGAHRYNHGPCLAIGEKGPTDKAFDITHGSERIWITQNTFRRYSDEIMSIKREASYVTLSWNDFEDNVSGKDGMIILIGHSDSHTPDIGRLKTTIHHNYFAGRDRQPRVRFGQVHIFNNFYDNPAGAFSYGAAAQRDSEVVIEGNFYRNVGSRPWRFDINSFQGYVAQRNNIFINTNIAATRGTIGINIFEPADVYEYTVTPPAQIPNLIMNNAGAGKWDYTTGEMPVPGISRVIVPAFGTVVDVDTEFAFQETIFAEYYQVQISTSATFSAEDIVADTIVTDTSFQFDNDLEEESFFFWRVRALNEKGPSGWSTVSVFSTNKSTSIDSGNALPTAFTLGRNYPNPFNPTTNIQYGLPESARVDLRVYDALGREVAVLVNQQQQAGLHTVVFDAGRYNLASGVYIYRLVAQKTGASGVEQFTESRTMLLVK